MPVNVKVTVEMAHPRKSLSTHLKSVNTGLGRILRIIRTSMTKHDQDVSCIIHSDKTTPDAIVDSHRAIPLSLNHGQKWLIVQLGY